VAAMLGNRPVGLIARNIVRPENYRALGRMSRVFVHPGGGAWRYLSGRGAYPFRPALRTPLGVVAPTTYSHHDFVTVTELFCRLDYAAPPKLGVVVDVGSNIGISALYFLTRGHTARCHLFEPVPQNVARLRENLDGFNSRWELTEAAVWDRAGTVSFGVEATGRYGGIGVEGDTTIQVPCLEINGVLERVLEHESVIDVLKVDTEGAEVATVRAIRPDLLAHIRVIYLETMDRPELHPDKLAAHFACDTLRLTHRAQSRPA
jgi:FkbM family methyltransferase